MPSKRELTVYGTSRPHGVSKNAKTFSFHFCFHFRFCFYFSFLYLFYFSFLYLFSIFVFVSIFIFDFVFIFALVLFSFSFLFSFLLFFCFFSFYFQILQWHLQATIEQLLCREPVSACFCREELHRTFLQTCGLLKKSTIKYHFLEIFCKF